MAKAIDMCVIPDPYSSDDPLFFQAITPNLIASYNRAQKKRCIIQLAGARIIKQVHHTYTEDQKEFFGVANDRNSCILFIAEVDGEPILLMHKIDPWNCEDKGSFLVCRHNYANNLDQISQGTYNIDLLM